MAMQLLAFLSPRSCLPPYAARGRTSRSISARLGRVFRSYALCNASQEAGSPPKCLVIDDLDSGRLDHTARRITLIVTSHTTLRHIATCSKVDVPTLGG